MTTLVIDTCLSALTLGLKLPSGKVVSVSNDIGIGHAERIAPAFLKLCAEAGIAPSSLDHIGVTLGPGSFMGQRVGLSFAKGLSLGSGAATVPLTTLEGLAEDAGGAVTVLIDARRGEVYAQSFSTGAEPLGEARLMTYGAAAAAFQGLRTAGSGAAAAGLAPPGSASKAPGAEALLALTARRPAGPLRTLYLRAPDAKKPSAPAL